MYSMLTVPASATDSAAVVSGPSPFVFAAMSAGVAAGEALAMLTARRSEQARLATIDIAQSLFACTGYRF